jgi:ubiquinone/menaquinone biosynthesis C-methylase UbiE
MFSTTEITSHEDVSDNVIHQRLYFAYVKAAEMLHGNVLEIGCGAGRGMAKIASACQQYTGIDKNKQLLEMHGKTYPHFQFIHQNIPPLTFLPDHTFDFVVSFQVIEHITNDQLFVEEIHRVLKPGGKALITTPNKHKSLTRNPWHIREYTRQELQALFSEVFPRVEVKGVTGSEQVMAYYERNRESVRKITRWDVLGLQYKLPAALLKIPYEVLNRMNRRKLLDGNQQLVETIGIEDYTLSDDGEQGFDFFCIAEKNR